MNNDKIITIYSIIFEEFFTFMPILLIVSNIHAVYSLTSPVRKKFLNLLDSENVTFDANLFLLKPLIIT